MNRTRATLLAGIALAASSPSVALAQGAGDNQYQDPFGNSAPSSSTHSSGSGGSSLSSTAPSSTGVGSSSAGATSTGSGSSTSGTGAATSLPRTGADTLDEALIGASLLLLGAALHRRTRSAR